MNSTQYERVDTKRTLQFILLASRPADQRTSACLIILPCATTVGNEVDSSEPLRTIYLDM